MPDLPRLPLADRVLTPEKALMNRPADDEDKHSEEEVQRSWLIGIGTTAAGAGIGYAVGRDFQSAALGGALGAIIGLLLIKVV